MHFFCTLFDSNYLFKGVAMLRSLKENCPTAYTYILCMDDTTREILEQLGLPDISCLSLNEIEDSNLLAVKSDRSMAEYCWTLSPCLPWHILQNNTKIDFITYLDADLYFFSPVQPLFNEIKDASIVVIEHKFTRKLRHLEVNGRFCVEWVSFRRDEEGMACLERWKEQCIDWCYHRLEEDRMGDQKYLDKWPEQYNSLHILQHTGAGLAPWNYADYQYGRDKQGFITVNGELLIFYHFHQLQILSNGKFDRLSAYYRTMGKEPALVYEMYEDTLKEVMKQIKVIHPEFSGGIKSVLKVKLQRIVQSLLPFALKNILKKFVRAV